MPEGFFELATAPTEGAASLDTVNIPYGLQPIHFVRMAEDIHRFLYELNAQLNKMGYPPLEDLHDSAGFSGLISRFAAERLWRASNGLVLNRYHNGYPDLIPDGFYPDNSVEEGTNGFEIKASRYSSGWQGHTVRAGWFAVIQFNIDDRNKGFAERRPTRVECILAAELENDDWKWHPAKPGKSRSGTTQIVSKGVEKLRSSAVFVHPEYKAAHDELLSRVKYKNRLPERKQIFIMTTTNVAKQLGITRPRLKNLLEEVAEPDSVYFDFGQGKNRERKFAIDAAELLRPLLEPEDIS